MALTDTRPSPIAGTWYSDRPDQLRKEVRGYIDQAEVPDLPGEVVAVMAPHAGYAYSGPTAGYAFRCILGKSYDLVAVASPYHPFQTYPFLTSAHEAYETPLGVLPIDKDALQSLSDYMDEHAGEGLMALTKDPEHSLEIELPFLQVALEGDFKLLPVMLSGADVAGSQALGAGLAEVLKGRNALLVASTDLSHFHNEETANRLDEEMLKAISAASDSIAASTPSTISP